MIHPIPNQILSYLYSETTTTTTYFSILGFLALSPAAAGNIF
jgi:hypothetical protein